MKPLLAAPEILSAAGGTPTAMNERPGLQRVPRVLIVDDAREVRQLFAAFLGGSGMHVTEADGGTAALAAARSATPDLVVTDITMPGMDGVELCRRFRAEPTTRDIPIVIVSGDVPADGATAWEAGCDAVLRKPCSRALLIATVQKLLSAEEPRRAEDLALGAFEASDLLRMDSDKG